MGKTINKKKKSKRASRLKKQMGVLVVAGLSLVLTISMAVGSTLAWFAGSTWASKDLYLGGPVYLEMSGDGTDYSKSGSGNLSISVSSRSSGTNADYNNGNTTTGNAANVMLPGQRVTINSYARVFSTGTTDTIKDSSIVNNSSGNVSSNAGNSTGTASYYGNTGKVTTSTTSVLRAKYSLSVDFDPSTGFNNFTSAEYQANYPVQHQQSWSYESPTWKTHTTYTDAGTPAVTDDMIVTDFAAEAAEGGAYDTAVANTAYDVIQVKCVARYAPGDGQLATDTASGAKYDGYKTCVGDDGYTYVLAKSPSDTVTCYMRANIGRRDAVTDTKFSKDVFTTFDNPDFTGDDPVPLDIKVDKTAGILNNSVTSVYKWKYVSKSVYLSYGKFESGHDGDMRYWTPGKANMLGSIGISSIDEDGNITANGYGIWILNDKTTNKEITPQYVVANDITTTYYQESDAFYKARCNAYLQSYTEYYQTEYGNLVDRNIAGALKSLDSALNNEFVRLINESSGRIQNELDWNAQWMYIDTVAGNDTNTGEVATSVGGWWYLTALNDTEEDTNYYSGWKTGTVAFNDEGDYYYVRETTGGESPTNTDYRLYKKYITETLKNKVPEAERVSLTNEDNLNFTAGTTIKYKDINSDGALDEGEYYTVANKSSGDNKYFHRLNNLLYEVVPDFGADTSVYSMNGSEKVYKVFSKNIPFVNGSFILPADEITNVFADARVTIQVSFQAVQAFLPYTKTIDVLGNTTDDLREGSEKALTIQNAIYVFNQAFDYSEGASDFDDSQL